MGKIVEKETQKIEMEKRGERYEDKRRKPYQRRENWKREPSNGQRWGSQSRQGNYRDRSMSNNFGRINFANHQHRRPQRDSDKQSFSCNGIKPDSASDTTIDTPNRTSEALPNKTRLVDVPDNFEYRRNLPEFRGTSKNIG